ncbi:hypothetical protein, partial [Ureibacillus thermosphaericus]|uniref:hypothetical protein n=1 Tax=Ureibacillus thermosphaericus TaxID=51173 RepID=UPI0005947ECD
EIDERFAEGTTIVVLFFIAKISSQLPKTEGQVGANRTLFFNIPLQKVHFVKPNGLKNEVKYD